MEAWTSLPWRYRVEDTVIRYVAPPPEPVRPAQAPKKLPGLWFDASVFAAFTALALLNALT